MDEYLIEEILISQNDNILILQDKVQQVINIQFNILVLGLVIVILGVIYHVVNKFIK